MSEIISATEARYIASKKENNKILNAIKRAYNTGRFNEYFCHIDTKTKNILLKQGYKIQEIDPFDDNDPIPECQKYFLVSW